MKPIFLIGYMGSGKSTLGRVLSEMLECEFTDLDAYIENRYHKTVKQIFAEHGEAGFRELERRMLLEVCEFQDIVIACGGGTPCFGDNMDLMNSHGVAVYLQVPVERLFQRLSRPRSKAKRPVIADKSDDELMQFISDNLRQRDPFYSRASIKFDTTEIETAAETRVTAARLADILKLFFANRVLPNGILPWPPALGRCGVGAPPGGGLHARSRVVI